MKSRQAGSTQEASAEKSELSVRTGRRIEKRENTGKKERHWRTREYPLEGVCINTDSFVDAICFSTCQWQLKTDTRG